MRKCHACNHELDDAALTEAKCPNCGAILHRPAQRTVDHKQFLRDRNLPTIGLNDATIYINPDESPEESLDLELTDTDQGGQTIDLSALTVDSGSDFFGQTPVEPVETGKVGGKSPTIGDRSDLTIDITAMQAQNTPEEPPKKKNRRSTHTLESDHTVDLDMSPDEARHLDSQWRGTLELGAKQGQTIRQRETITGFRSSLPVKSRYIREKRKTPDLSPSPKTLAEVPDYELLDIIGEGGMGVVYAAHQSSIARTVAVKMLKPSVKIREDQRDKFISEAVVTGELDHPNIVPIYDLGSNDQGALFYSMKRVKGTPWDKVIDQKPLDENLSILLRVADAVAFAHAGGVIHRDLKPENVMLGDYGEVLVMDWGLARITPEFAHVDAVYQADSLGGTPAYMAPEQTRCDIAQIDQRSDIYALGAILKFLLTGHSKAGIAQKDFSSSTTNSSASPALPGAKIPKQLAAICAQAMAEEKEERYASAQALAGDIVRFLNGLAVTSYKENIFEKILRWLKQYRFILFLIAAYILARILLTILLRP